MIWVAGAGDSSSWATRKSELADDGVNVHGSVRILHETSPIHQAAE